MHAVFMSRDTRGMLNRSFTLPEVAGVHAGPFFLPADVSKGSMGV